MAKVHEALNKIQTELKAPKNLHNDYGGYNYRNFEGICEALKPHLKENNCILTVADDVKNIGERYYVVARATLTHTEDGSTVCAEAWAREDAVKKGMSESQITGATSSYARKYCLNGLFLLDDTKDPDTNEFKEVEKKAASKKSDTPTEEPMTDEQKHEITTELDRTGVDIEQINTVLGKSLKKANYAEAEMILRKLRATGDKQA